MHASDDTQADKWTLQLKLLFPSKNKKTLKAFFPKLSPLNQQLFFALLGLAVRLHSTLTYPAANLDPDLPLNTRPGFDLTTAGYVKIPLTERRSKSYS